MCIRDRFGVYRDHQTGLAHARLSIIDLASGQQPLTNERGTLWVTFNGEIFNYVELGQQLRDLGHQFRTASDTEVIVHAWEEWGEDAFRRFNGQWAIGLWDRRARRLILSRDRLGVRHVGEVAAAGRSGFGRGPGYVERQVAGWAGGDRSPPRARRPRRPARARCSATPEMSTAVTVHPR